MLKHNEGVTYLVIVEPDHLEVGEVFELLENLNLAIGEMDLCEITSILGILNRKNGPWITSLDFFLYHFLL